MFPRVWTVSIELWWKSSEGIWHCFELKPGWPVRDTLGALHPSLKKTASGFPYELPLRQPRHVYPNMGYPSGVFNHNATTNRTSTATQTRTGVSSFCVRILTSGWLFSV
jgi:hypothetical protein